LGQLSSQSDLANAIREAPPTAPCSNSQQDRAGHEASLPVDGIHRNGDGTASSDRPKSGIAGRAGDGLTVGAERIHTVSKLADASESNRIDQPLGLSPRVPRLYSAELRLLRLLIQVWRPSSTFLKRWFRAMAASQSLHRVRIGELPQAAPIEPFSEAKSQPETLAMFKPTKSHLNLTKQTPNRSGRGRQESGGTV